MSINNGMNTQMGTKWFTFYTKVRPWLALVFSLPAIVDFIQYTNVYFSNVGLLLSFIANITQIILCIMVFKKSNDDYNEFVKFVNGVLIFETCNIAFQAAIQQIYVNKIDLMVAMVSVIIIGVLDYLIWYRLNIKYFRKRLIVQGSPENSDLYFQEIYEPKKINTPKIKYVIKKIINILKCILFIPLSILVSEMLLMLVFGNFVEGVPALILLFIVSTLLFTLLYYLFIGRKNKKSKTNLIDFEEINSRDKAREEFRKGNLEILYLLSPMFGGSKKEDNIIYVPKGVNKLKVSCDNIIADLLDEEKVKSYDCRPEYKGNSFIPSKITITSGKDGNVVFQETINIW